MKGKYRAAGAVPWQRRGPPSPPPLLLKRCLHLRIFDGSSELLHLLSNAPPQQHQQQGAGVASPLAAREASIGIVSIVRVKCGRNLV